MPKDAAEALAVAAGQAKAPAAGRRGAEEAAAAVFDPDPAGCASVNRAVKRRRTNREFPVLR